MTQAVSHHAYLDRIEDGIAVLLLGVEERERLLLPAGFLPEGAREGDVLVVTLAIDRVGTEAALAETAALIAQLAPRSEEEEA